MRKGFDFTDQVIVMVGLILAALAATGRMPEWLLLPIVLAGIICIMVMKVMVKRAVVRAVVRAVIDEPRR